MQAQEIQDVLNVSQVLSEHGEFDAAHNPGLIGDLIDWADNRSAHAAAFADDQAVVATVEDKPKAKRGKATESDDSLVAPEPSPDDEPF